MNTEDSTVTFSFTDKSFPVAVRDDGTRVVALKPICESIGIGWDVQWEKTRPSDDYANKRYGICLEKVFHAGQTRQMVCVRVDRVYAFLHSLNPESIRSAGNEQAAKWLEKKQAEWDGLLSRNFISG